MTEVTEASELPSTPSGADDCFMSGIAVHFYNIEPVTMTLYKRFVIRYPF